MALIMNNTGDMFAICSKKFTGTSKMVETLINSLSDFKFRMEPCKWYFGGDAQCQHEEIQMKNGMNRHKFNVVTIVLGIFKLKN